MSLSFKTLLVAGSLLVGNAYYVTESAASSVSPTSVSSSSPSVWQSKHFRQHQLVGKIWSTKDQRFVEWTWLQSEIKTARFVLLGEIHTNADHHRWQAEFLKKIGKAPTLPLRLVVEMIPTSLGDVFKSFKLDHKSPRNQLPALGKALKWEKRGWGKWSIYQPIFNVALALNASVVPGNIDRADTKRIGRKGMKAITQSEKSNWSLDVAYSKNQTLVIDDLLFESHCKLVPKQALSPMRLVQRVRDGAMAGAMLAKPNSTSVLIAGNGHIRNDIAVPRILRAKAPNAKTITVSFTEVRPDYKMPQDYELQSADKRPVFDYLFFTPKFEIKDHCAELAKRFGKHKLKKPSK